jgi:CRISPR system Cascade subunit CasD
MADYLVFQLYGPMAAWGDIAVGEYRPSFAHPSKSAIIGILAAALGIRRDEEERQRSLAEACSFAVRVDAMGTLLRDYHTAQVPSAKKGVTHYSRRSELLVEKLNTILSTRDYRCDAAYTVAIRVRDRSTVTAQMISEKLRSPEFILYLGRKSCPLALPLQPKLVEANNFKEAFMKVSFSAEVLSGITTSPQVGVYWESGVESGYESDHIVTRRDEPLSRKRWQFSERHENYASIRKEG